MDTKPFYMSKTLWFNALAVAVLIAQTALDFHLAPLGWEAAITAGINIALRFLTSQGISLPPAPKL